MDLIRLREVVAAPIACLYIILLLCVLSAGKPRSMGILIPMMRTRVEPLNNCEFNGFTVRVSSDGKLAGESKDDVASRETMLSRIREARGSIQDDTIFVITDPRASYGDVTGLIADIHGAAPPDHVAVVTQIARVEGVSGPGEVLFGSWADRCRFEWPAVQGQPRWPKDDPIPLQRGRISVWEALRGTRD